jgi:tRNA G18 (ribose-2'-O)-methylase SpoU
VPIHSIDELADPRLADYRDLRDAAALRRRGLFAAEGRSIARRLLDTGRFRARSLLLTAPALEELRDLLPPALDVFMAPRAVIKGVVGFDFHRGCLGLGERGAETPAAALLGARLLLVLDRLADPENVGGVFRNAMAFGAGGVLLAPGTADPLYRKAVRVSFGGTLTVPFAALGDRPGGLAALRAAGFTLVALTPRADALDIADLPPPARLALVIGSEGDGVSDAACAAADVAVRIPMAPGVDALNVATATGIALHRLAPPRGTRVARAAAHR